MALYMNYMCIFIHNTIAVKSYNNNNNNNNNIIIIYMDQARLFGGRSNPIKRLLNELTFGLTMACMGSWPY